MFKQWIKRLFSGDTIEANVPNTKELKKTASPAIVRSSKTTSNLARTRSASLRNRNNNPLDPALLSAVLMNADDHEKSTSVSKSSYSYNDDNHVSSRGSSSSDYSSSDYGSSSSSDSGGSSGGGGD